MINRMREISQFHFSSNQPRQDIQVLTIPFRTVPHFLLYFSVIRFVYEAAALATLYTSYRRIRRGAPPTALYFASMSPQLGADAHRIVGSEFRLRFPLFAKSVPKNG